MNKNELMTELMKHLGNMYKGNANPMRSTQTAIEKELPGFTMVRNYCSNPPKSRASIVMDIADFVGQKGLESIVIDIGVKILVDGAPHIICATMEHNSSGIISIWYSCPPSYE